MPARQPGGKLWAMADADSILPEQLCVGLYIELDLPWFAHPFPFSRFKIKSEEQLASLRQLGLAAIRYDPERSDCLPLRPPEEALPRTLPEREIAPPPVLDESPAMQAKRARIEHLTRLRTEIEQVEKTFLKAADALKRITRNLHGQPEQAFEDADALVSVLVSTALAEGDCKIHAMGGALGEESYFHSLNVAVLAMIIGNAVHLKREELHQLGLGALMHDIGHMEVPDALLIRRDALNKAEQAVYELHCRNGVKLGRKLGLTESAQTVIGQHHERADGSGYPEGLSGNQISLYARIVAITNAYDNLCNPTDPAKGVTPYEALSQLFAKQRHRFDESLLRTLIRCLGVYPPGSLVRLSNDQFGLVLSVNPQHPLKPSVMVYNPDIPQEAALILDLEHEPELKLSAALRAAALPGEVVRYLNPRQRVSYYFDRQPGKKK